MTIHCCFKYCCFCCYQCDRRREKARVYRLSGILPVAPDVQLHKVFNFQQTVLRSAHYQSVIETQPKRTPKKQAHTPAPWPCDEEEGDILLPHCRSLSLQFSLHYDHQRHTLSAHLQHVTSLEPFAGFGKLSVTLFLTPDKKDVFEANASYKHGNTVFDRIFEFTGLSINEVIQKNLVFRVYHHMYNCSVKKRLIGTTTVPLDKKDIYGHKITKEVDRNGKTWESGPGPVCRFRGEVQVSLTYKPELGLLHGVVQRGANLNAMNTAGDTDPYVTIDLLHRKQLQAKWNSTIKLNTLAPVYNEQFQFDIATMDMSLASIGITVMSFDRTSRDAVIGTVSIGDHSPSETGRQHWAAIQKYQNESITFWHTLLQIVDG